MLKSVPVLQFCIQISISGVIEYLSRGLAFCYWIWWSFILRLSPLFVVHICLHTVSCFSILSRILRQFGMSKVKSDFELATMMYLLLCKLMSIGLCSTLFSLWLQFTKIVKSRINVVETPLWYRLPSRLLVFVFCLYLDPFYYCLVSPFRPAVVIWLIRPWWKFKLPLRIQPHMEYTCKSVNYLKHICSDIIINIVKICNDKQVDISCALVRKLDICGHQMVGNANSSYWINEPLLQELSWSWNYWIMNLSKEWILWIMTVTCPIRIWGITQFSVYNIQANSFDN